MRIGDRHGGSELRKLHETLSNTSYPILCVYIPLSYNTYSLHVQENGLQLSRQSFVDEVSRTIFDITVT